MKFRHKDIRKDRKTGRQKDRKTEDRKTERQKDVKERNGFHDRLKTWTDSYPQRTSHVC